ncbi:MULTISPECIES: FtsX-like permease family protein [Clostridium]|uniref:FtsX-like permease family protein n=1 Tax=Clostridium cibarium TaxID=2762247 RepID=A0ABR8PYB1_9CLOT|nr:MULTISPECIES: FtsX-like permease family protein [Clostridium]MBD7913141.1 FtsX-like permease family protein [Clostridium cibarium]
MKAYKVKYFFEYAIKSLKRNITTTIASMISISIAVFIVRLFLLYMFSVKEIAEKELMLIGVSMFVLIIGVLLFLIITIIKMSMFCREYEISVMKAIGATDWFVRWIFITEGLIIGIIGALLGSISMFTLYEVLYDKLIVFADLFNRIDSTLVNERMLLQYGIIGAFIGIIGYSISLRKILKR